MPRYSSDSNIYPEEAPYQPSRSALRRRFGNRAITSSGPRDSGRPGSSSTRDAMGFTDEATWRSFFTPSQPQARAPIRVAAPPSAPATFYDESSPFGRSTPGTIRSGTNFVSKFGYGGVRSAADVKAGRNELTPQKGAELMAWDKFLKSPAPVSQPATSINLLPDPRSGSPMVAPSRSDYAPTPTADDYYGSIIGNPSKLSITTGVLGRLGKASTWDEPI